MGNGTSFGLNDLEAPLIVAYQAKEWISAHALNPDGIRYFLSRVAWSILECARRTSTF